MASKLSNLLPLILSFIFLFQNGCLARNSNQQSPNVCMIQNMNPLEPAYTLRAEAGQTEFWENNDQQFQCAGVELKRHTIEQRGLFLPVYANSPHMLYVEQGRGMFGILVPGCPETYQSSQGSQQQAYQEQEQGQVFGDRHQKVGQLIQGDVITVPAGSAHWIYNEGNEELVIVALADTSNNANQLDNNDRTFFIAGNPQSSSQGQRYQRRDPSRERQSERHQGYNPRREEQSERQQRYDPRREEQSERHQGQMSPRRGVQQYNSGNIFSGFDIEVLIEAFGIDERIARKLQGQEDERGHIIRAEQGLQVIKPPVVQGREERQRQHQSLDMRANGIEETICTAKYRENIDNPARADVYNPRAGRFTSINSYNLPILSFLQLSIERGVLYRNAIFSPHWFQNCHNVMYITRGESWVQIVNEKGQAVFDGPIREGQVLVVPQNYAILKQAGEQGCEWVGFNTAENAMMNTLSGRTSAIRGLPVDVVANAYQISREQAQRMKYGRDTTLFFESRSRSSRRVASA